MDKGMNINMDIEMDVDRVEEPAVQLIGMLGQPYDSKRVQAVLKPYGVKRMPAPKSYFNDTMISCAKASLRMDLYRIPKINVLTGLHYTNPDEWIIGAIHFLPLVRATRSKCLIPLFYLRELR